MKKTTVRIVLALGISTGYLLSQVLTVHGAFYSPVSCDSQSFFRQNACDLCYEEKNHVVPGQKLEGLFDTWLGNDMNPPIVYEDEQVLRPTMINLAGSGTEWGYSAPNPDDIWQLTPTIAWTTTGATNRKVVTIDKGKQLKFMEQKKGTYITLVNTNKKDGEFIGMMKYPLIYRYIDITTQKESDPIPHFECVTYRAGELATQSGITIVPPVQVQQEVKVTPPPVVVKNETPPSPPPQQITQTKTGPEMYIIGLISLILASSALLLKRKN